MKKTILMNVRNLYKNIGKERRTAAKINSAAVRFSIRTIFLVDNLCISDYDRRNEKIPAVNLHKYTAKGK